jgi:hypothetical protein
MPILSHGIFNEHGCATVLLELICNVTYLEYESTLHRKNACRGHVIASEICGDEGSSPPLLSSTTGKARVGRHAMAASAMRCGKALDIQIHYPNPVWRSI